MSERIEGPNPEKRLADLVQLATAFKAAQEAYPSAASEFNYRAVFRWYCLGNSLNEIARETGLVRSTVSRMIANMKARKLLPDPISLLSDDQKALIDRIIVSCPVDRTDTNRFYNLLAKSFAVPTASVKAYIETPKQEPH